MLVLASVFKKAGLIAVAECVQQHTVFLFRADDDGNQVVCSTTAAATDRKVRLFNYGLYLLMPRVIGLPSPTLV